MTDESTAPERRNIESWLAGVRVEIERVGAAIEPLMAEQARLREREALLQKLLRTLDDGAETPTSTAGVTAVVSEASRMIQGSVLEYVSSGVLEVLREHGGGPMHINDIFSKFVAKGFRVPGAGRPANLTAHLARCEDIVSPNRGFYALKQPESEEGKESSTNAAAEEPATKSRKRRRRKRR